MSSSSFPQSPSSPFPTSSAPAPPYYAVIFTSIRRPSTEGYESTAQRMVELAQVQPGFLGMESVSSVGAPSRDTEIKEPGESTQGITVSYWEDRESIEGWRKNSEHVMARAKGRKEWYERFEVRVCRVEKAYGFHV